MFMKDFVIDWLLPEATKKALCSGPVSCPWVWELLLTWMTFSQVKLEHPLTVQPQQEVKLHRHGVEFHFCLPVIVVVVG